MSTQQVFYTTVPESGMFTFPEELRGKPLKIVVEKVPRETNVLSIAEILKDCDIDTPSSGYETPKKGILGLRGVMKGHTTAELEDARYEYLMEKYVHDD